MDKKPEAKRTDWRAGWKPLDGATAVNVITGRQTRL